ncbi:ABC transporter substrate-binding protein [Anaerosporobacter faecicola]|uniref:ABC transporter substrate-binding protein n=1 Tax=Anaerosporobacter faecicola TaxID=2718714 RepID=UPI00143AEF32|nr:ABC transporter substrate-binding protein [Anaerosporobacter faecicola]
MKKAKKVISALCILTFAITALTGCGSSKKNADTNNVDASQTVADDASDSSKSDSGKKYKIGVSQYTTHDALDSAYKGFVDGLAEAGYTEGDNIEFDFQNAQGDASNCNTIASKLVNDNPDLILAIATPAAQSLANVTKDIPIVVTAVTDPADSGIVETNEAPGGNITGTSDLNPVKEQMDLLLQLLPDAKKIAILYCSSEANSKFQADLAAEAAANVGLETQEATVSNTNDIEQVVQSLVGKVNAIYTPTDNTIASGMSTVAMVANSNNIPIICGESGMVENGGLATYGINYYNLGKQTATMAVKILTGESKPADMPIEYLDNMDLTINEEVAAQLGITIPDELKAKMNQ